MRDRGSAIIIENNKVALIERVRGGMTYYVFPGGGIEHGETPEEATKREAYEELGVTILVKECFDLVDFNGTQYYFLADIVEGTLGTGMGEEFSNLNRERGTYRPMWMDIKNLTSKNVKPNQIAEKIYREY